MYVQFASDVFAVGHHGVYGDKEFIRNLLVAQTINNLNEHVAFAFAECIGVLCA